VKGGGEIDDLAQQKEKFRTHARTGEKKK
jgi:hypothetical protein